MAIKAGTFIHDAQGYVIDRIQSGGVTSMNIPQERIYELGNYQTVATIFDIPDLSFDLESTDVSTETEALIHGKVPTAVVNGDAFDFTTTFPLDIISPFKAGNGAFNVVKGLAVPYLTLDTVSYKFGVKANATETFTFKGDSIFYIPGSPYYESVATVGGAGHTYSFAHTALPYVEAGNTLYALSVCVKNTSTGAFQRLFFGTGANGYSNTSSGFTTVSDWSGLGYTTVHYTYGSSVAATYNQAVHQDATVKPAAIRSKDIVLYVGAAGATVAGLTKWSGVQSFDLTRKVNLQQDEEFGNSKYVSSDYDTADVTGSITVRPNDAAALFTLIEQITGTTSSAISGPISNPTLEVELQVKDPVTGSVLKSWNVPDARFTVPALQGKVQTKLDAVLPFTSDAGLMSVFKGTN